MDDNNMDDESIDMLLCDNWLTTIENDIDLYNDFYKSDLLSVNTIYILINSTGEINRIKKDKYIMIDSNIIPLIEIKRLIQEYENTLDGKKYSVSILKYNIDIDPVDISYIYNKDIVCNNNYNNDKLFFFTEYDHVQCIPFNSTINILHDLNELIFVFHEIDNKDTCIKTKTKNYTRKKTHLLTLQSDNKQVTTTTTKSSANKTKRCRH